MATKTELKVLIYADNKAEIVWPGQKSISPMRDAKVIETITVDVGDKMRKALPQIVGLDEILDEDCRISLLMERVAEAVRNAGLKKTQK